VTLGHAALDAEPHEAFAGGDRRRFDLVVGADGLHSGLRAMEFRAA
jgi:2-polyprenyl-6-methoxyphenol hydroxylase-like FAD-dependent oxidoreductase